MNEIDQYPVKMIDPSNDKFIELIPAKITLTGLNYKQRKFCLYYPATGSPTLAAEMAGYCAKEEQPRVKRGKLRAAVATLMRNPTIRENINIINEELTKNGVASALRIKLFWTEIMEDESQDYNLRLQASKLLAKCYPDFSDKLEVKNQQKNTLNIIIANPHAVNAEEQIELNRLERAVNEQSLIDLEGAGRHVDSLEPDDELLV